MTKKGSLDYLITFDPFWTGYLLGFLSKCIELRLLEPEPAWRMMRPFLIKMKDVNATWEDVLNYVQDKFIKAELSLYSLEEVINRFTKYVESIKAESKRLNLGLEDSLDNLGAVFKQKIYQKFYENELDKIIEQKEKQPKKDKEKNPFKEQFRNMTKEEAKFIRDLRVNKGYTWRQIAAECHEKGMFGGDWDPPSNQIIGLTLCEVAAEKFGEDYLKEPWN